MKNEINKKQSKEFFLKCTQMLKELGAKETTSALSYNLVIQTRIGDLYLKVEDDNCFCYSLFGNFLGNEMKAKEVFGHWKYNYHGGNRDSNIDDIIEVIKVHISYTF
ncbi:hypothetical protein ABGT15_04400 [Flavobacterium enshiense]|uniref:hypothetical protein n=1 Tax=Flavobacterium enshiense TaxID=1341165 RepID=UPI00345C8F49